MSKSTVIYKQRYKSIREKDAAGYNVAHLQYIATRPGVVKNAECGFGLWGRLPGDGSPHIQTDLEQAKALIREASRTRTLYRGLVSVGQKDAEQFDLYNRTNWEQLVNNHMKDIAKQMDIQPEDLRWCASMHMKKHHPHVHLIFWDAGKDPRQEYIPKEVFDTKMEQIRAAFSGDLHHEEIRELQQGQRELSKDLSRAIQSVIQDTNPAKGMDLDKLEDSAAQEELAGQFAGLLRTMPQRGSLRFQYLPPEYKEQVLKLVRSCMEVPELARELSKFEQSTLEISRLYANSKETAADALQTAREKLEHELANCVTAVLKDTSNQIRCDAPEDAAAVKEFAREAVRDIVPKLGIYKAFLESISPGTPPNGKSNVLLQTVVQEAFSDNRIQLRIQGYAIKAAGLNLDSLPRSRKNAADPKPHTLCGRVLTEQQWDAYRAAYQEARKYVRQEIMALGGVEVAQQLRADPASDTVLRTLLTDIKTCLPSMPEYQALLRLLPRERIPGGAMNRQLPDWREGMREVQRILLSDARFRVPMQAHGLLLAGIDPASLPDARPEESGDVHTLFGKVLTDEQWDAYQAAYQEEKRELWNQVAQQAREDVGWTQEQVQTDTGFLICNMLRLLSQSAGQRQASRSLHKSRDKSREQQKDERAKRQLGSSWVPE
ncbi:MAG: hypothetical protein J6J18_06555 [Oscillospiraceae bacterium]|nr:hypothetical protein [Oscillospiraceae bacterium]